MWIDHKKTQDLERLLEAILKEGVPLQTALQDPACQKDAHLAQQLEEETNAAQQLRSYRAGLSPLPDSLRTGRAHLETRIRQQRTSWRGVFWLERLDWNLGSVLVVLLLLAAITQLVIQTQHALSIAMPGDRLYVAKIAGEQIQLDLANSPEEQIRLHLDFAQRRVIEVESLIVEERFDLLPNTLAGLASALGRAKALRNQVSGELPADIQEQMARLEGNLLRQLALLQFYATAVPARLRPVMEHVAWLGLDETDAFRR
jgi:hypothetical protein